MVTPDHSSALHRLKYDEIFHFYLGDSVEMIQISLDGALKKITLGKDILNNEELQVLVPAGVWQGLRLIDGGSWALLGTTMAPRYEDADFELGDQKQLIQDFPNHSSLIKKFSRAPSALDSIT